MSLNVNEKKYLKEFIDHLKNNPYKGNQESCGKGKDYWNADMWTIQVSTCLLDIDNYKISDKFKGNRFADPNRIKTDAKIKLSIEKNLQEIKDAANCLLICEIGRGLDIVMANRVKKWDKVYCYDQVDYSNELDMMFDNVDFVRKNTGVFSPETIMDDCIVIMNHSIYPYDKFKKHMNSVHGIINGNLMW